MFLILFFPLFLVEARQKQIVELGGLQLLIPLTRSIDEEVQRLAAHSLANLSVDCEFFFSFF